MNAPVHVFDVIFGYSVLLVLGYFPFLGFEIKALRFPFKHAAVQVASKCKLSTCMRTKK